MRRKYKERIVISSKPNVVKEQLALMEAYRAEAINVKERDISIYVGEVDKVLSLLPDSIVDCVVTSPPYWRQRDYRNSQQIGQEKTHIEYIERLVDVFNSIKRVLKSTGTFFLNVGYKYQNKELLLIPELLASRLQKDGWTLLNKIIWQKPNAMPSSLDNRFSNVYEPIFLFIKEESKYNYYLSIDELRVPVRNFTAKKMPDEILGLEVENSLLRNRKKRGYISKIFKESRDTMLAQVDWEDEKKTIEIVNDFSKESQIPVGLVCEECEKTIKNEIDINNHISCKGFFRPILPFFDEKVDLEPLKTRLFPTTVSSLTQTGQRPYEGKFKLSPDNRGASPGARKSLFGEYLVVQRRYKVFQPIIANYLRAWRKKKNIPIKKIDRLLGCKDTAGHWFRKDTGSWGKGGSIPLPEDWFRLKEILEFDDRYDSWVTKTHLVLQTVKAHPRGRNPGDVWSIKLQPLSLTHFATFPEELVKRCIKAGCPEGGVVLDPFAGSGTTGRVAHNLGRDAILIELIPEYFDIIKKRCKNIREVIYVE